MEYLLINAPKPASKDKLLQALTGWDKEITPNAVEVYISRLRGKLEPHGVRCAPSAALATGWNCWPGVGE
jgi:DNA-binding response OmpR family regulator